MPPAPSCRRMRYRPMVFGCMRRSKVIMIQSQEDMTVLGINAGFGDPIAGEFPFFERIGVAAVRQDLFAHGETASIEALVAEFSNRPARALFMLAGGKIQAADGSNRIEPHVLAAPARRLVAAARAVRLQQC